MIKCNHKNNDRRVMGDTPYVYVQQKSLIHDGPAHAGLVPAPLRGGGGNGGPLVHASMGDYLSLGLPGAMAGGVLIRPLF